MGARSRALGARIVLTGTGGDELFAGSNIYLVRSAAPRGVAQLALEWYRIRGRTLNGFRERVVHPALAARDGGHRDRESPRSVRAEAAPLVSRRLRRADIACASASAPRAPYGRYPTLSATEQLWGVTTPMFSRIRSTLAAAQMRAGITNRSPFLDRRVHRFALGRPRHERVTARETKRLLRHAMKGLLPDEFLAPRPARTGDHDAVHARAAARPRAAALRCGVRAAGARRAGHRGCRSPPDEWRAVPRDRAGPRPAASTSCLQTEIWLRAHLGAGTQHGRRAPSRSGRVASRDAPADPIMNSYQVFGGVLRSELEFPELDRRRRAVSPTGRSA